MRRVRSAKYEEQSKIPYSERLLPHWQEWLARKFCLISGCYLGLWVLAGLVPALLHRTQTAIMLLHTVPHPLLIVGLLFLLKTSPVSSGGQLKLGIANRPGVAVLIWLAALSGILLAYIGDVLINAPQPPSGLIPGTMLPADAETPTLAMLGVAWGYISFIVFYISCYDQRRSQQILSEVPR